MIPSRRSFLLGAAAMGSTVITPDTAEAARLMLAQDRIASDWSVVTRDVEGDIAPHRLTRIHGRAPAGLEGALYRNGPAKFRRPGGSAEHWFDGDGLISASDFSKLTFLAGTGCRTDFATGQVP